VRHRQRTRSRLVNSFPLASPPLFFFFPNGTVGMVLVSPRFLAGFQHTPFSNSHPAASGVPFSFSVGPCLSRPSRAFLQSHPLFFPATAYPLVPKFFFCGIRMRLLFPHDPGSFFHSGQSFFSGKFFSSPRCVVFFSFPLYELPHLFRHGAALLSGAHIVSGRSASPGQALIVE